MGLLPLLMQVNCGKPSYLQGQFPFGYAAKSTQSEIEQLLSTRHLGSGLGGEQIVFPLLAPSPSLTSPQAEPDDVEEENITWARDASENNDDDVVLIKDEYLCSDGSNDDEQHSSLELVLGEEPSLPNLDNELLNLLAGDANVFTEGSWDHMMGEPHPASSDDVLSSAESIADSSSLGDEQLPPWDLDDVLLQPPVNKKPLMVEPLLWQQQSPPATVTVRQGGASFYPPAPPPVVQHRPQSDTLPVSNDIMVRLSVPGQPDLSVTLERDKLISMPADRFNHLMDRSGLSENDMAYMKDWRRKGKNKMAAQQARKRKREEVDEMAVEVDSLREELAMLKEERRSLQVELEHYPRECRRLEQVILNNYHDHHDNSVTADTHRIVLLSDTLLVAPVVQ